jgi:3-oxo-5alpha-steroid 4-dehydrogenase
VDAQGTVVGVEINALPEALWEQHQKLYRAVDPWRPFNAGRGERAIADCDKLERGVNLPRSIRARRGVVLCTGGFIYNLSALRQHQPSLAKNYAKLLRLGSMGDDGSGIEIGQSAGGVAALMDTICVARTIAPPNIFPRGIIVNQAGERFINEAAYAFVVGAAVARQPGDGRAWLILTAADFWTGVRQSLFPGKGLFLMWGAPALINILFGGTRRARSLRALAKRCGIAPAGLEKTVSEFNRGIDQDQADPLGKTADLMHPLAQGPFYAVNMSLNNTFSPAQTFTLGGLMVDESSGLLRRADGSTINGLYAAGRAAVGLCSKGYVSGLAIADVVFSGRRAGRDAARRSVRNSRTEQT